MDGLDNQGTGNGLGPSDQGGSAFDNQADSPVDNQGGSLIDNQGSSLVDNQGGSLVDNQGGSPIDNQVVTKDHVADSHEEDKHQVDITTHTDNESRDVERGEGGSQKATARPQSVVDQVKLMRQNTDGKGDFAKTLAVTVLCGTACTFVVIAFMLAIPIAMLVIGTMFKTACPREPYIPTYLVVGGSFGVILAAVNILKLICRACCGDPQANDNDHAGVKCLQILSGPIGCFLSCWFVAGAVWTYRIHGDYQSDRPAFTDYCDNTLYLFTFWLITSQFILMGMILVGLCVGGACLICCSR